MLKRLYKDKIYSYTEPEMNTVEKHGFETIIDHMGVKYQYNAELYGALEALKNTKDAYTREEFLNFVSYEKNCVRIEDYVCPDGLYRFNGSLPGRDREWKKYAVENRKKSYTKQQFMKLISHESQTVRTFLSQTTDDVVKLRSGGKILLECPDDSNKVVVCASEELQRQKCFQDDDTPHKTLIIVCGDLKKKDLWQTTVTDVTGGDLIAVINNDKTLNGGIFNDENHHYIVSLSTLMSIHRGPITHNRGSKRKYNSEVGFSQMDTLVNTMKMVAENWFVVIDGTNVFRNNVSHAKPRGGKNYMSLMDFITRLESCNMLQYLICKSEQHVDKHDFDVFPTVCLLNPNLKIFFNSWKTSNRFTRNAAYHVVHQQKQSIVSVVINHTKPRIQYRVHSFSTDDEETAYTEWLKELKAINLAKNVAPHSKQKIHVKRFHTGKIRSHILCGLRGSIHPDLYHSKIFQELHSGISGKIKAIIRFINGLADDKPILVCGNHLEALKYVHSLLEQNDPTKKYCFLTGGEKNHSLFPPNSITFASRSCVGRYEKLHCKTIILVDICADRKREERFLYIFDRKASPTFTYMINKDHYAEKCVYEQWFTHLQKKNIT